MPNHGATSPNALPPTVSPIDEIHSFWFGSGDLLQRWFGADPSVDEAIEKRFGSVTQKALEGDCAAWEATPEGTLALLLVLDQFPRNLFRGQAKAFAGADRAERLAQRALDKGIDQRVPWLERSFFYLPLEHAEDLLLQHRSVALFEALHATASKAHADMAKRFVDAAIRHRDCIARFGRFPARNIALARTTSVQEAMFLRDHPAGF